MRVIALSVVRLVLVTSVSHAEGHSPHPHGHPYRGADQSIHIFSISDKKSTSVLRAPDKKSVAVLSDSNPAPDYWFSTTSPDLSPDGSKILVGMFELDRRRSDDKGRCTLVQVDLATRRPSSLLSIPIFCDEGSWPPTGLEAIQSPRWAYDGVHVVFVWDPVGIRRCHLEDIRQDLVERLICELGIEDPSASDLLRPGLVEFDPVRKRSTFTALGHIRLSTGDALFEPSDPRAGVYEPTVAPGANGKLLLATDFGSFIVDLRVRSARRLPVKFDVADWSWHRNVIAGVTYDGDRLAVIVEDGSVQKWIPLGDQYSPSDLAWLGPEDRFVVLKRVVGTSMVMVIPSERSELILVDTLSGEVRVLGEIWTRMGP